MASTEELVPESAVRLDIVLEKGAFCFLEFIRFFFPSVLSSPDSASGEKVV